jgi:hypothetical protein
MSEKLSIGHRAWDMEQLFQDAGVFRNGMNDRPSHMYSYMTVIDFQILDKTFSEIKDKFTREEWLDACEYWLGMNYLSPMAGFLARTIKRKLETN